MSSSPVYGGFFRRFLALGLDFLIMCLPSLIAGVSLPYVGAVAVAILYDAVFESSIAQSTPGKFMMGLKVTDEKGQRLSFSRAVIRHLMKYVSVALLGLGFLLQLVTDRRQALHDLVAGALVIRHSTVNSPNWFHVWVGQMKDLLGVEAEANVPPKKESTTGDDLSELQKLQALLQSGALTEAEFQAQKSQILQRRLQN